MTRIIPETHELGTFDPHTFVIELLASSRSELEASIGHSSNNRPAQILAHELCHWTDLAGTVWGQKYLDFIFSALDVAAQERANEDVLTFPSLIRLFDEDRAILFPAYYKTVDPAAAPTTYLNPWSMTPSAGFWIGPDGVLDQSRPIFFTRFNDSLNGRLVARQPLTVGTLLELRAIASEIATFNEWLGTQPPDEQKVSRALFRQERIMEFYEPSFTTYSVAAHIVSFVTGQRDFMPVCLGGALLADVCLNLTEEHFERLRHPKSFRDFTPQRLRAFVTNRDRGYLFACLANLAREAGVVRLDHEALEEIVKKGGLLGLDDIYGAAEQTFQKRVDSTSKLTDPELRRIRVELARMGLTILRRRRNRGSELLSAREYANWGGPSPVILTNDGEIFNFTPDAVSFVDAQRLHALDAKARDLTRNALRAARGFDFEFSDYVY